MAAVKTAKRRPVARTKYSQLVNLDTLTSLRSETTIEGYHSLFLNIELLMSSMLEHGVDDEVITMINCARLAQHVKDLAELDKYLTEIVITAGRYHAESDKIALKAETELYSPEATIHRLRTAGVNPLRLRPREGGEIVTLSVTVRLSTSLPTSSAAILKAEQVYGPFWTIRARCFVVSRNESAAPAFLAYLDANHKAKKRNWRLLTEYKLMQTVYRNVDVYMLVDLPRLVALRDTKIMELGLATKAEMQERDYEDRLPIITKAELAASKLPNTVSAESKRYIVCRIVEMLLLLDKKNKLRKARYARDGEPKQSSAAASLLSHERFKISQKLANTIGVMPQEVHKALTDRNFASYVGAFVRNAGRAGWEEAVKLAQEWNRLRKMAEV